MEQTGKTDKGSQVRIMEELNGVPLAGDKMVVPPKTTINPLEPLHSCQSCCVSEFLPTHPQRWLWSPGLLLS